MAEVYAQAADIQKLQLMGLEKMRKMFVCVQIKMQLAS